MALVDINYRLNNDTQSLGELWKSIAYLSSRRVSDNQSSNQYPLQTRKRQVESLKHLVIALENTHKDIEASQE